MSYDYTPKRTFAQKVKRFFAKLTLAAAFAAAVGTPAYNYYGTVEEVEAQVLSVDVTPPKSPEEAPKMVIRTDKGIFSNDPTGAYKKDKGDAAAIAAVLKPGVRVKLKVYGVDPSIGGYNVRNDFKIYRNIIRADAQSVVVLPQSIQNVLPLTGPIPVPTGNNAFYQQLSGVVQQLRGPLRVEDQTLPAVTASNANLDEIAQKVPQAARDLGIMSQLPVTGHNVFNALQNPKFGFKTELFPVARGSGAVSTFYSGDMTARIARGDGTQTTFHEYFHGWQHVTEQGRNEYTLTMKDAIVMGMLREATAVGYEMASLREAQNHAIPFYAPNSFITQEGGTINVGGASEKPENIKAFNEAYEKAYVANMKDDPATQEAKALQAGAQAVVRRLMAGQDASWRDFYSERIANNINRNRNFLKGNENAPGYQQTRDAALGHIGYVSDRLSLTPPEFLGPNAGQAVDKSLADLHMSIKPGDPQVQRQTQVFTTPASGTLNAGNLQRPAGPGPV